MLFNSWTFVGFVIPVLLAYYALPRRGQNLLLLVASYIFYGAWDWRFLSLLLISTIVDYCVGRGLGRISDPRVRRGLLIVSVTANLSILGFFKYFNFFVENAAGLLSWLGLGDSIRGLDIVLPVGISFYTFQTMSYAIDVYRRQMPPVSNLLDFALYIAFFPQLVAGPIERATHLLPQLSRPRSVTQEHLSSGVWLLLVGYFKKLVIADNLAPIVSHAFASGAEPGGAECLIAIYAFAFQIYGDFSGYSDIARGLARLMGIELMCNFNLPYLARDPSEFWRRWHISLSTWLRDYLYIPLGGNRHGPLATYRNLLITMLLGGLWHGAVWTYVAWGAFHGLLLCIHRYLASIRPRETRSSLAGDWARRIGMFHLVCLGWLLFRAKSLTQAWEFGVRIATDLTIDGRVAAPLFALLFYPLLLVLLELWTRNCDEPWRLPGWQRVWGPALATCVALAVVCLGSSGGSQFIYFQF